MHLSSCLARLATAALLLAFGTARADSIVWTFENAVLSDSSSVSGSFWFDAATNTVSNVNVSLSSAALHGATQFVTGYNSGNPPTPAAFFTFGPATVGALNLSIDAAFLGAAGGVVALYQGSNALGTCEFVSGAACTQQLVLSPGVSIAFTSGDLRGSAVPLPGTAGLLAGALVAAFGLARRRPA
jgi:hypothetical protein